MTPTDPAPSRAGTSPTTGPTADTGPRPPSADTGPLTAARDDLAAALAARHRRHAAGGAPPRVVPLGSTDALDADRDPWTAYRPAATVHLTSRAVLLGPWHPDGDSPALAIPPAPSGNAGQAPDPAPVPTGTDPATGPWSRPCGQCLAIRWQRLRSRSEREALEGGHSPSGGSHWPVLTDHALDAVWHAHRATVAAPTPPRPPAAPGLSQVTRVDLGTLALVTVPLLPEPLCPHCAPPPSTGLPRPAAAPKPAPTRYRLRTPESFDLPAAALANPVCGALGTTVHLNPASTTTAPVSGSHFVRGYAGLNDVTWSGQANSYRTSRHLAYLEGLERYAGTHQRDGTPLWGSFTDLTRAHGPGAVLDPRTCGSYPARTYDTDPMVSAFDPERPIPWLRGYSLRDDRPVLVPARLVHYGAGVDADNFVFECSNGCASGSCWTEAVFFGLLEVVERDAFLLGWYGWGRPPRIDAAAGAGPQVRAMLDRAALLGYRVHAFDNRADLPVPVVTVLAERLDGRLGNLAFAAAAGFDPEQALEGALSEVLTYVPHLPYQVSERRAELDRLADDFDQVRHLTDHAQLFGLPRMARYAEDYLAPGPALPLAEAFADWPSRRPCTGDLRDDLRLLRDLLVDLGHDVLAVDQTTPEQRQMGLRTVRTLVPGLLPMDFGWHRQRALRMPRLRRALAPTADGQPGSPRLVPHPFP